MSLATFKLAVRVLLRRKVFTAISLFGVTLTLLVLVVATAMLDATVSARPPESRADRSLLVMRVLLSGEHSRRTGLAGMGLLTRTLRSLPGAEEVSFVQMTSRQDAWIGEQKHPSFIKRTDGAFWRVHDFEFVEGGPYDEEDDTQGRAVAVISEAARDRMFSGESALGRTFDLDGRSFRVLGVVKGASFLRFVPFADAWVPLGTLPAGSWQDELSGDMTGIILARRRSDLPAIQAEFAARVSDIPLPDSMFTSLEAVADTHAGAVARSILATPPGTNPVPRMRLFLLLMAAGFMLLPALNLVNLNLSRVLERAPEIGVRKAFGATCSRLVLQFVAENVLLTVLGGLLAFALAPLVLAAINATGLIPGSDLAVNLRVLAGGLAFAVAFGILSGAWPAWRMSRLHPVEALRGGAR